MDTPTRYWSKVQRGDGCWLWMAGRTAAGYGVFRVGKTTRYAHRLGYEMAYGPIAKGRHVLHRCDNPPCCNPEHLFLGDQIANNADKQLKGRTPHGEAHYRARLTTRDVQEIRALAAIGIPQRELAVRYGVIQQAISRIVVRKIWKEA